MNKFSLIISILITSLYFWAFKSQLEEFPWNPDIHPGLNIIKYPLVLSGIILGIAMYKTITPLLENSRDENIQTKRITGKILDINYSTFRISNIPRFKVRVKYLNLEKDFDPIHEKVQFNFEVGDNIFLWINPEDNDDVYLDINESLSNKYLLTKESGRL